jgi:hypothetical protein
MRSIIERNTNRIALGNRQGRVIVSAVEMARMLDCTHRFARHLVRHALVGACSSLAKRQSKQAAATGAAGYLGLTSPSTSRPRSWQSVFPLPAASVARV